MTAAWLAALLPTAACRDVGAAPRDATPSAAARPNAPGTFTGLEGFWGEAEAARVLEETERFHLEADLSALTAGERRAVARLLEVGAILQDLYERSRHPDAAAVRAHLVGETIDPAEEGRAEALRDLYRLFSGPLAAMPDGRYVPFAPVRAYAPGRDVYPADATAAELERYAAAHPEAGLLDPRTVVRRRTADALAADRAALAAHPWLAALHPTLEAGVLAGPPDVRAFYAVPHSLAYAEPLARAAAGLFAAAAEVRADDADLADYLEQRARDLLSNDYEGGDAAWVAGRFARLDAQIGAYETYDDHLLGQKAFFGMSVLVRAPDATAELARGVADLEAHQAALPGGPYGDVGAPVGVGVYDVVADFGQARGANTASILPNEPHVVRKYGRKILLRRNVLAHPVLAGAQARAFRAIAAPAHADDLGATGAFDRTVWHEVGHSLGPRLTRDGRPIAEALGPLHNTLEELKADLVALFLLPRLARTGALDAPRERAALAAGVLRATVSRPPSRAQAYPTMRLMQHQYFLDRGALAFDAEALEAGVVDLRIDYAALERAVAAMLSDVLRLQHDGDRAAAEAFVARWTRWEPALQGRLGEALEAALPQHRLPSYAALDDGNDPGAPGVGVP